ncbi:MAG TPA: hypothetical protein VNM48_16500, partial [Chloroflexota bacterium]|nr:hypothetical protein [Chloroflexota bacterium]
PSSPRLASALAARCLPTRSAAKSAPPQNAGAREERRRPHPYQRERWRLRRRFLQFRVRRAYL